MAGLYWWNPVVWWARRALREAEEQCCDAWAVGAMPRRARTYAAALMAALDFISGAPTAEIAAASAVIGGRRHVTCLQRRMRMIVRAKTPRGLSWAGRLGVLGLAALILPLAPIWAQDSTRTEPDSGRGLEIQDKLDDLVKQLDSTIRQQLKAEADDDDDKDKDKDGDDDHKEVADHLERLLRDLGEKLSKDLGPVGEEIVKSLDKAATEVSKALDKGGIVSKDLQEAFDKAREELHQAFRSGGKIDQEAREGLEKARQHLGDAVDKAKDELKETARDGSREGKGDCPGPAWKRRGRQRAKGGAGREGETRGAALAGRQEGAGTGRGSRDARGAGRGRQGPRGGAENGARAAEGDAPAPGDRAPRGAAASRRASGSRRSAVASS